MKKKTILFLSAITLSLAACGGSGTDQKETGTTATTPAQPAKTGGELLIAKADCVGCHHKENKLIGPSYIEVADKYEATEENINLLTEKILKGGKGVWGPIAMTPHANMPESDAKEMVKYILSLKK
ncbi:hypothetical protein D9M68_345110 [compost metagenome]